MTWKHGFRSQLEFRAHFLGDWWEAYPNYKATSLGILVHQLQVFLPTPSRCGLLTTYIVYSFIDFACIGRLRLYWCQWRNMRCTFVLVQYKDASCHRPEWHRPARSGKFPRKGTSLLYFFVGDHAFSLKEGMMKPFPSEDWTESNESSTTGYPKQDGRWRTELCISLFSIENDLNLNMRKIGEKAHF